MSEPLLPVEQDPAGFDRLLRQQAIWRPAIEAICQRHELAQTDLAPAETGSSVIWTTGPHVIKLMPPFWARDCELEILVLQQLAHQPELPVPQLLARGELEGWPYFIMTRLPGRFAAELWPKLKPAAQVELMEKLGQLLRKLHQLPVKGLEALAVDWPAFVQRQLETFVARQLEYGVPEAIVHELYAVLAAEAPALAQARGQALMHCEIMPEHLLLSEKGGSCQISGLIDFGDPMVGYPEYEFGGVCVFFTAGRPELRRAFLLGYGYDEAELTPALSRRLMAAGLLHRFGLVPLGLRLLEDPSRLYETCFSL